MERALSKQSSVLTITFTLMSHRLVKLFAYFSVLCKEKIQIIEVIEMLPGVLVFLLHIFRKIKPIREFM